MDGYGKLIHPGGSFYIGNFKLAQMDGHGKIEWADGRSYNGNWLNGKENGIGWYISRKGENTRKGEWQDGIVVRWF